MGEGKASATGNARVIHPGDPDHPASQVRAAGNEPGPVFSMRLALHPVGEVTHEPTIAEIEAAVATIVELTDWGYTAKAEATRTDR